MGKVYIFTDLLATENLGLCSKYIISLIRCGCEHFGTYTFNPKAASKFSDYNFKPKNLLDRYNNLVNCGIVIREKSIFTSAAGQTINSHTDRINEDKLKSIL